MIDADGSDKPGHREPGSPPIHASRLQLIWDVTLFQFKLAADGLRDLLLSPVSIVAGIMGLLAGGEDPHRYFRRLLRLGRRSEIWINLFGLHRRRGTSDEMVDSLRERVFTEAAANPWLSRAGKRFNATLDNVNAAKPPDQRPESEP
jgi:hypothetical protein